MKKQFVTYEISNMLKEMGFDEPCIRFWLDSVSMSDNLKVQTKNSNGHRKRVCAPLWQQVIDWLRETHGIQFYVKSSTKNMDGKWIDWVYVINNNPLDSRDGFDSYSKAMEVGILTILKRIHSNFLMQRGILI